MKYTENYLFVTNTLFDLVMSIILLVLPVVLLYYGRKLKAMSLTVGGAIIGIIVYGLVVAIVLDVLTIKGII